MTLRLRPYVFARLGRASARWDPSRGLHWGVSGNAHAAGLYLGFLTLAWHAC